MKKGLILLATLLLMAGFASAAWYTQVKPGIVAGEDTDGFYTCVAPNECGGVTVYAMGEWQLPPRYERALIAENHWVKNEGGALYYRVDTWGGVEEVGTRAYVTLGMFGNWYTAIVPAPPLDNDPPSIVSGFENSQEVLS